MTRMHNEGVNTGVDNPADHGTDEHCERCTGSGCSNVADSLVVTVRVTVRRATGPAQSTPQILWALQNAVAGAGDGGALEVETARYDIEHVDYDVKEGT